VEFVVCPQGVMAIVNDTTAFVYTLQITGTPKLMQ